MPSIKFNCPNGPGAANTSRATEFHTSGKILATDAPCLDGRNADIGEAVTSLMAAIQRARARRVSMPDLDVVAQVPAVCMRRLLAVHTAAHRVRGEVLNAGN
ncbi:hypothetical protein [Paraburkholderia sp. GAS334]|uniref:hypothetical protein n=1 Tax=Paraburkholderia sp. GAS334 TaxID=3035131 RepID=UPI003D220855